MNGCLICLWLIDRTDLLGREDDQPSTQHAQSACGNFHLDCWRQSGGRDTSIRQLQGRGVEIRHTSQSACGLAKHRKLITCIGAPPTMGVAQYNLRAPTVLSKRNTLQHNRVLISEKEIE